VEVLGPYYGLSEDGTGAEWYHVPYETGQDVTFTILAGDDTGISEVRVTWNDDQPQTFRQDRIEFPARLTRPSPPQLMAPNYLYIEAWDTSRNLATLWIVIRVAARYAPGELLVKFSTNTPTGVVHDVIQAVGGWALAVDAASKTYSVGFGPGVSLEQKAAQLSGFEPVLWAHVIPVVLPDACAKAGAFPSDPRYGSPTGRGWYLCNEAYWISMDSAKCVLNTDCPAPMLCVGGICGCVSDGDCPAGLVCGNQSGAACGGTIDRCGQCGVADGDIGFDEAVNAMFGFYTAGPSLPVGIVDSTGLFDPRHNDIKASVWTNFQECCGANNCPDNDGNGLPDCIAGEAVPGIPCTSSAQCGGAQCIAVTTPSYCVNEDALLKNSFVPTPCNSYLDCFIAASCQNNKCKKGQPQLIDTPCAIDADCAGNACSALGPIGTCTDGCPGACNVDDDGDGYADWDDPEVRYLVQGDGVFGGLINNNKDDDGDGVTDEPDEAALAAWDDDEDGVIDDIHGADFFFADHLGKIWTTTHDDHAKRFGDHALSVAGSAAATVHNGQGLLGVYPKASPVMMGVFSKVDSYLPAVHRYLDQKGIRAGNFSWGTPIAKTSFTTDQDFLSHIDALRENFQAMVSPSTLYTFSAGNEQFDLDLFADAKAGTLGNGKWRFPTQVQPKFGLVIASSDPDDTFTEGFLKYLLTGKGDAKGSNWGLQYVDFAAPGNYMSAPYYQIGNMNLFGLFFGTSNAAPVVASAAVCLMAAMPQVFDRVPGEVMWRLAETVTTNAVGGQASFMGKMKNPGRVDVADAMDMVGHPPPFPPPPMWQATWRLGRRIEGSTHGAQLIVNPDGALLLVFVFGGPYPVAEQPILLRLSTEDGRFHDVTVTNMPPLPADYSDVDAGDVNGDLCPDMVLAGFYEPDPANPPAGKKGAPDRLLLQSMLQGACSGIFVEAPPGSLPDPGTITRGVTLVDVDNDGDLDLYQTNAKNAEPGGDIGSRLLLNDGVGHFTVSGAASPGAALDPHATRACDVDLDGDIDLVEVGKPVYGQSQTHDRLLVNKLVETGQLNFVDEAVARGFPLK